MSVSFRFFSLYHNAVSARVQELASEDLEANEIVSMLTWVLNTYKRYCTRRMMGRLPLSSWRFRGTDFVLHLDQVLSSSCLGYALMQYFCYIFIDEKLDGRSAAIPRYITLRLSRFFQVLYSEKQWGMTPRFCPRLYAGLVPGATSTNDSTSGFIP